MHTPMTPQHTDRPSDHQPATRSDIDGVAYFQPQPSASPVPERQRVSFAQAAAMARSGLRRYPRELLDSLRGSRTVHRPAHRHHDVLHALAAQRVASMWLGHATCLLKIGGKTVLTDPVFSNRIGLTIAGVTFGVARHQPTPIHPEDLPPLDLVLISHAHFDHLDRPSLDALARRPGARQRTVVVTARNTARLIPSGFADVIELDWSGSQRVHGLEIDAIKPIHWGARFAADRHRGFNAYFLRSGFDHHHPAASVLFGGDTAYTDAFDGLGPVDLAVLGIGSYEPWNHRHATPEQAWKMFLAMTGGHERSRLLPMHHATFPLGEERPDEPLRRLLQAAADHDWKIVARRPGDAWLGSRPA